MRQLDLFAEIKKDKPVQEQQPDAKDVQAIDGDEARVKNELSSSPIVDLPDEAILPGQPEVVSLVSTSGEADSSEDFISPAKPAELPIDIKEPVIYSDGIIKVKIKPLPPADIDNAELQVQPAVPVKRGRKPLKELEAEADLIEIPDDEQLYQKQYYSISEVARWFRVNTSLLRFWCNEFTVLKPRKNRKGDRLFRPEDVKMLLLIYQLLRVRKFSIEGAKEYLKSHRLQGEKELQLTQSLLKFKSFLLELRANLQT